VAEPTVEARIRDLERRLDMDPGSRLFVALAEEYRKIGRFRDALSALQKGLLSHPGYVAAQVALGRVYLEANQTTDAIATFTKVLSADPGNLVAAKSLADIYLGRGDKLESLKKYKLYRALSGDRKVDAIIADLEPQVAPKPVIPPRPVAPAEPLPPPPSFQETDKSRRRPLPRMPGAMPAAPLEEPFEITPLSFEPGEDSGKSAVHEGPFLVPTRDVLIAAPSKPAAPPPEPTPAPEAVPSVTAIEEAAQVAPPPPQPVPAEPPAAAAPAEPESAPLEQPEPAPPQPAEPPKAVEVVEAKTPSEAPAPATEAEPSRPTGRALADLYYAQGHYAEALQIYDDLVNRNPFDQELQRMRRDAEARLLPAGSVPEAAAADSALEKRLARIRVLKQWLAQVQAG
jgi:tetratricopeptide (TPR) repeat protein